MSNPSYNSVLILTAFILLSQIYPPHSGIEGEGEDEEGGDYGGEADLGGVNSQGKAEVCVRRGLRRGR
jgi:hypothetical protein